MGSRSFALVTGALILACLAILVGPRAVVLAPTERQTLLPAGAGGMGDCGQQLADLTAGRWPARFVPRPELAALIETMKTAPFVEASRAAQTLLAQPELASGANMRDVQALLGFPDRMYGTDFYYMTNGGPLEVAFRDCRMSYEGLLRPGSWSGTDEDLAERWAKSRTTRQWIQFEPMTGWLTATGTPKRKAMEVDLNGGFYGDDGTMSFTMADGATCAGRWHAAFGTHTRVTSGEMLRTLGPRYMPRYRSPTMPRYTMPERLESWQQLGRAEASCSNGRTLRFEFVTGTGEAHGWGVAQDDRGAVYQFTF